MSADPRAAYLTHLRERQDAVAHLDRQVDRIGRARVAVVLATVAAAAGGVTGWFPTGAGLAGLVPLAGLFVWGRVLAGRRFAEAQAADHYARAARRLAGDWSDGPTGDGLAPPDHPFAADLDLFGDGSLFQRVCLARTAQGRRRLAGWLLLPADAAEVRSRQAAVADLRDRLDLRERLAVGGGTGTADLDRLAAWAADPPRPLPAWRRTAVLGLGWVNLVAAVAWLGFGVSATPLLAGLLVSLWVAGPLAGWARRVARPVEDAVNDLPLVEALLAALERERFGADRLVALQAGLAGGGVPSARVRELRALADWSAARRNPLFLPVAILMLWDVRVAVRLDAWRATCGRHVGRWAGAVAELEALGSLAGYAFDHPDDPFPTVLAGGPPVFDGTAVGHPLLPADRCVRNDVRVGGAGPPLLVVSGSNMSGKSTLLRAVGVNAVLALAGGPVRADRLAVAPCRLGATLRVRDSLRDGRSRFFAEAVRVRDVLALAAGGPVLFLFDELFAGTNSADRRAGAEGVLRALLARGAAGLVTTHDLALAAVAGAVDGRAANVHFADQVTDGGLSFDYVMRPGTVPHGNGLALLRAVGLEV